MRRRDVIVMGGLTALQPLAVMAQQQAAPTVGFLCSASAVAWTEYLAAFHKGLAERGYEVGRNVSIEYRWAEDQLDRLPAMAADLVARRVAVIVAAGGAAPAMFAKATTSTIPIVFAHGADPVKSGLVSSLNRPGGNITGVTFLATSLVAKRLELLRELVPGVSRIAILHNPDNSDAGSVMDDIRMAIRALGVTPLFLSARHEHEFEAAFAAIDQQKAGALFIAGDRLFISGRRQLAALAAQHAVPTMHDDVLYPSVGGLITYGPSIADAYRQVGIYTTRILSGEKSADLPVMQPTRFNLIINLKIAKALRLDIPAKILALADQVIE